MSHHKRQELGLEPLRVEWTDPECAVLSRRRREPFQGWGRRLDWVRNHYDRIERTAANPEEIVEWWSKADAPFSFVAACKEWIAASKDPGYLTRLPIPLDATCNALQHMAALSQDEVTGERVNLTNQHDNSLWVGIHPRDAYRVVVERVIERIETEREKKSAQFWLE